MLYYKWGGGETTDRTSYLKTVDTKKKHKGRINDFLFILPPRTELKLSKNL